VFESQKQFIENASHELQTPLSVIQSRLEALIGQTELTGKQASIIEGIIVSTQRIKKLNKTLLLLSKIENRQFLLNEKVDIKEIIDKSLEFFEEQKEALNLQIRLETSNCLIIQGNVLLSETLIQNLLKNAFVHNVQKGSISIACDKQKLTISNTGRSLLIDQDQIFSRFYKKSDNPETWGLGLAIANKITQTSGWSLKYAKHSDQHIFEVLF
jgi:signal transduction histidine kinase